MAIDPSPTAEATRLMEPWRTSPATKIPGTLVSSKKGSRCKRPIARAAPVGDEIGAGQNESMLVALDQVCDRAGVRHRANENKQCDGRDGLHLTGLIIRYGELVKPAAAFGFESLASEIARRCFGVFAI